MKIQIVEKYDEFDLPVYAVEADGRAVYVTDDIVVAQDFKQKFLQKSRKQNQSVIQTVRFNPELQREMLERGITL